MRSRRPLALLAAGAIIATASMSAAASRGHTAVSAAKKGETPALDVRPRLASPEDRYALAGGCYVMRSASSGKYVVRDGTGFAATGTRDAAERLHFQAYDLGKYLLFASKSDFVSAEPDPASVDARPATGTVKGAGDETLKPMRDPVLGAADTALATADTVTENAPRGTKVVAAAKPSAAGEWVVTELGSGYALRNPVDDHEEENPGPLDPPIRASLTASNDGAMALTDGTATGKDATFTFELADGCAVWPEIATQVTGPVATGASAMDETKGYIDAHLHLMAFEFLGGKVRCGRPWHPYGVTYALVDCPDHGPGGRGSLLEDVLSHKTPGSGHDTVGWPTFGYWPHYDSLTHEQVYYTWLERAWRGGLRMFTALLVDNGVLCEVYPLKKNSCNEMDGVRLQAQRLHELERYIDAQSGGPGRGWLRIVDDPFEARRVVNAGKLAVVMGIEVSVPFDCGEYLEQPRCTAAQIEQRLDEVHALGVRQMELTNKFDNALTGVTGDDGDTGLIVNNGNKYETGHYWKMHTCEPDAGDRVDKTQHDVADDSGGQVGRDAIFGGVLQVAGPTGATPVYPAGPHCNDLGLSDLGKVAVQGLMDRGMLFDPDHMSAKARKQALDYVAARHYTGVVSSHSWADDPTYEKITEMGGFVTPHAAGSTSFVKQWAKLKAWSDSSKWTFGVGYGSDVNGFSAQGAPRNPASGVQYPFTGLGGVSIGKQTSGEKTWDVNTSGVDHYGLYPDWIEDGRLLAGARGAEFLADMQRGVEAYLQMWERASGVGLDSCRDDVADLTTADTKALHHNMTWDEVLTAVGQPHTRTATQYTYCTERGPLTVVFGSDGRIDKVS